MNRDWHNFSTSPKEVKPDPPHALIMGDLEFMGHHTAKAFLDAGWRVSVFTSSRKRPMHHGQLEYIDGDRSDAALFIKTFEHCYYDCTIDLEGRNADATAASAELFFGRTRHHIHLSSDAVYAIDRNLPQPWREEELVVSPGVAPPNASADDAPMIAILACENVIARSVKEKGFPATVVRSARVSGPGDPTSGDHIHMLRIMDDKPLVVPVPAGCIRHIHAPDLATVLLRIATHRQDTVGVTFNAAGSSIVSLSEYLALLASILDKPLHIVQVHADSSGNLFAEPGYPFYNPSNAFADIAKLENVLGFRPRGFEKFLPRIVQWYLEEYRGEVPEAFRSLRDREEKVLCGQ